MRVPIRWHLAARLEKWLPQVRGRTRLIDFARGRTSIAGHAEVHYGPGLVLEVDLTQEGLLWFLPSRAPALQSLIERLLEPGDTFVDVGANIGMYTCLAARRVRPGGLVVALEPVPPTSEKLRRNVGRNQLDDVVSIYAVAAGEQAGETDIYLPGGAPGLASALARPDSTCFRVPIKPLDEIVSAAPRLIKIDVEGFETSVVRGMGRLLASEDPPLVVAEVIESLLNDCGSSVDMLVGAFRRFGYSPYELGTAGVRPGHQTANVLFAVPERHQGRLDSLRDLRFSRDQTF